MRQLKEALCKTMFLAQAQTSLDRVIEFRVKLCGANCSTLCQFCVTGFSMKDKFLVKFIVVPITENGGRKLKLLPLKKSHKCT